MPPLPAARAGIVRRYGAEFDPPGPRIKDYVLAVRPSDGVIINGTGAAVSGYTTAAAARGGDVLEIFPAHEAEHALTHAIPKLETAVVHAYPAHAGAH